MPLRSSVLQRVQVKKKTFIGTSEERTIKKQGSERQEMAINVLFTFEKIVNGIY